MLRHQLGIMRLLIQLLSMLMACCEMLRPVFKVSSTVVELQALACRPLPPTDQSRLRHRLVPSLRLPANCCGIVTSTRVSRGLCQYDQHLQRTPCRNSTHVRLAYGQDRNIIQTLQPRFSANSRNAGESMPQSSPSMSPCLRPRVPEIILTRVCVCRISSAQCTA
jgi:hypothetical protein